MNPYCNVFHPAFAASSAVTSLHKSLTIQISAALHVTFEIWHMVTSEETELHDGKS